jgi:hypothetical protein
MADIVDVPEVPLPSIRKPLPRVLAWLLSRMVLRFFLVLLLFLLSFVLAGVMAWLGERWRRQRQR